MAGQFEAWEGVATPGWRCLLAAPLRRIGRQALRGARRICCAVGPWRLGDLSRSLPCAGGVFAASLGGSVPRGGARVGQRMLQGPTCAVRHSSHVRCPVAGPPRHIKPRQRTVMYWTRVPTPPSPIINLISSNSKHPKPAPLAPKYWVFKGPYLPPQSSELSAERSSGTSMTSLIFIVG